MQLDTQKPQSLIKALNSKPFLTLIIDIFLGTVLTIGSLVVFLKIRSEVLEKEMASFDMGILQFFYTHRSPELTHTMLFITNFGGKYLTLLWISLLLVCLLRKYYREAVLLGFSLSMAAAIDTVLKLLTQRQRPSLFPLILEKDFSFPSGHSMNSFVFYMTVAYLVYHLSHNKKLTIIVTILAMIMILLIGTSRIYLGVHYPTDVLAGYIAGLCWFMSILLVQKSVAFYRLYKKVESLPEGK